MARERVFSDQQVIEAANVLLGEGKNINGTSLRNKIGTGRPSALMSAFKALEGSGEILAPIVTDSTEQIITHQELPPEIAERLSVMLGDVELLVHQINDHAHYTVEQRLNQAISEANERAASAARREAESIQEQDKAFEQLEDALESNTDLQEQLKQEHKEKSSLNAELNVVQSETKAALDIISEREERLGEMQKQIISLQKQLNIAESDKAKAEGQVESLNKQLEEKSEELVELNGSLKTSEKELGLLQGRVGSLIEQIANQRADNDQLQGKFNEEREAHIRSESHLESLNSELNKKNEVLLETQASLGEAQKLSSKLEGQLMQYQKS